MSFLLVLRGLLFDAVIKAVNVITRIHPNQSPNRVYTVLFPVEKVFPASPYGVENTG